MRRGFYTIVNTFGY